MLRLRRDEEGATAVIVVLSLIALLGMIVLTVDVGQLLFKRRAMVNASDAAALAAAQSCAGLDDSDDPQSMADVFAVQNVSVASGQITELVGCDGPAFGHVTVEYGMNQDLFFAGVLGFNGPAQVTTEATAGWGPTGAGNPVPIVVYTGQFQGGCRIEENLDPDEPCYLWYDNDRFGESSFGFLNLCTTNDLGVPGCKHGWDVAAGADCQSSGANLRNTWIGGNWTGGPNELNWPDATYVCREGGLSSDNWAALDDRAGDELMFPVNDCATQVDGNGAVVGCDSVPHKYNIIGFIVLRLDAVLDSAAEWGGISQRHCSPNNVNVTPGQVIPLSSFPGGDCPNGNTPSGVLNFEIDGLASSPNWTYDDTNKQIEWTGPADRVNIDFDWWLDGECGQPPGNSSAVCIKVTTVEVRFGGSAPGGGANFNVRAIRLCDLEFGGCPEND